MSRKISACPQCLKTDKLGVWTYENGGRHVECDRCWYLGPCAGSIKAAIKAHNEARAALTPSNHPTTGEGRE